MDYKKALRLHFVNKLSSVRLVDAQRIRLIDESEKVVLSGITFFLI